MAREEGRYPSLDQLDPLFKAFRASRVERFRVELRRRRVAELQARLAQGAMELDTFNREVWQFDSLTRLDGKVINGRNLFDEPVADARLDELERALRDGRIEMHGNYVWG